MLLRLKLILRDGTGPGPESGVVGALQRRRTWSVWMVGAVGARELTVCGLRK